MFSIIFDWLDISLELSPDCQAVICAIFSMFILQFLLDFLKMIYYTVSRR